MLAILWVALIGLIICFALASWLGAPYLPTRTDRLEIVFKLLDLKPGDTLLDVGAGNGRVLAAAAERGIKAIGYEINPVLWWRAKANTRAYRDLVKVRLGNYWRHPLPKVDGVYVFLINKFMPRLDRKLASELDRPTPVVSLAFAIPGRKPVKKVDNFYLYRYH